MPKKRNLEYLLKKVPSPTTTHTKIITMLFAILMFSVLIYIGSVTYTGLAISEISQPTMMKNQNIALDNQFEVLDIKKLSNSVLNMEIDSNTPINVFAEIDDCPSWKNKEDTNNNVLYAINNIQTGNFKIGDPSENTIQQVDLYKTDNLCLIFINREFPNTGNVNVKFEEIDVNKWRIV